MKTILTSVLLLASITLFAQNVEVPTKEFTVSLAQNSMELKPGEVKKVEARILKSKAFQKGKVQMGISSNLPKGIQVSFSPDKGDFALSEVIVSVGAETVPGLYNLILNATVNNKTKGSILKVLIQ